MRGEFKDFGKDLSKAFDQGFKEFDKIFGDESFFAKVEVPSKYPPSNFYVFEDGTNVIELAVAGYPKEDISIDVKGGYVVISGKQQKEVEGIKYVNKGISRKAFETKYKMLTEIKDVTASYTDGILKVVVTPDSREIKVNIN
jgi:molecular chaperone IbpA